MIAVLAFIIGMLIGAIATVIGLALVGKSQIFEKPVRKIVSHENQRNNEEQQIFYRQLENFMKYQGDPMPNPDENIKE